MLRRDRETSKEETQPPQKKEAVKEEKTPKKVEKKTPLVQLVVTQTKPIEKEKPKKVIEKKIEPIPEPKIFVPEDKIIKDEKVSKKDSEYYGIGLIGSNDDITMFKGLCKMKRLNIGKELITMIKDFNIKNKL